MTTLTNNITELLFAVEAEIARSGNVLRLIVRPAETVSLKHMFSFGGIRYYGADVVMQEAPKHFKGCKSTRDIIKRGLVKDGDYMFSRIDKKTNQWIQTDGSSKQLDKVYLGEAFIKTIAEINPEATRANHVAEDAPPALQLDDHECFLDEDGDPLYIEVRGKRDHEQCYFSVNDCAKAFEMPRLYDSLIHANAAYEINTDFKYFIVSTTKQMFLTFRGLVKVLNNSRVGVAKRFQKWADEILFIAKMGTDTQRHLLADGIKYGAYNSFKQANSLSACDISCVYIFKIGNVADLRDKMTFSDKLSDKAAVYKWGRTKNLMNRYRQHNKTYGHLTPSGEVELVSWAFVPEALTSEAECKLKQFVIQHKQLYKEHDELITIDHEQLQKVKKHMTEIGAKYSSVLDEKSEHFRDTLSQARLLEERSLKLEAQLEASELKRKLLELENAELKRRLAELQAR